MAKTVRKAFRHQFVDTVPVRFQNGGRKSLRLKTNDPDTAQAHVDSEDSTSLRSARRSLVVRKQWDGSFGNLDDLDRRYAERSAKRERRERRASQGSSSERRSSEEARETPRSRRGSVGGGRESKSDGARRSTREQAHESAYTSTARESGWDPDAEQPPRQQKAASFIQEKARARQARKRAAQSSHQGRLGFFLQDTLKSWADSAGRLADMFGCQC